jgi:hypothetical protein
MLKENNFYEVGEKNTLNQLTLILLLAIRSMLIMI